MEGSVLNNNLDAVGTTHGVHNQQASRLIDIPQDGMGASVNRNNVQCANGARMNALNLSLTILNAR